MKLSEYLQHRGGNNITVAEALAIGIVINPGWPQKYADKAVPENLAKAVLSSRNMPWNKRRKLLKDVSSGQTNNHPDDKCLTVKELLYKAAEIFPDDPYRAFVFVDMAICVLERKETPAT